MDKSVRIAILSKSYFGQMKGGAELQLKLIGSFLCKSGYDVHYIAQDRNKEMDEASNFNLHLYSRLGLPKFIGNTSLPYLIQILYLLMKVKPDVIIARPKGGFIGVAGLYCRLFNAKLIWHLSSTREVKPFKWKKGWKSILKYMDQKLFEFGIKNADSIVAQAEFQAKLLKENFDLKCNCIIPNFYEDPGINLRKNDTIKVLWVANSKPVKQPGLFIQLARKFKGTDDLEFIMIGRGVVDERKNNEIPENLTLEGELELHEVDRYMAKSHILVNTSISEGFPNTFIQAWLNEMLVLSLNVDPDHIFENYKIGIKTNSLDGMVQEVKRFLNKPDNFKKMRQNGRYYALEHHTLKNVEKYFKVLNLN